MILTKKYQLIWNSEKVILGDPFNEYEGSETYVGEGMLSFESDIIKDIEEKIIEEELIISETI